MGASAKKIGKYVLYELLAKGGMAEVYRGKMVGASGFEKKVAIKRVLPDFSASDEFQKMFLSEAKVMSTLDHANIVQVIDFFREKDELFLVMDLIFGRNLRQILKRTQELSVKIPIPIALYIMIKTAEALDYAHRKVDEETGHSLGIIHRDVSPQNVMLSFDGEVKIVDFGIAKLASSAEKTQTGVLKGKFGYMSPEQVEGLTLDYRSDIFSFGVVLYEALAGQKLFQADTEVQVIKLIQTFRPPHIAALRPEVSEELEKVLHKVLDKDRVRRYQSALEVADRLHNILMKDYGGCNALKCADFLKQMFKEEYGATLQLMRTPVDIAVAESTPQVQEKQGEKVLAATGTEGGGSRSTHLRMNRGEGTLIKMHQNDGAEFHEFVLEPQIRFKVELDPGVPWEKHFTKGKEGAQGPLGSGASAGKSKSIFVRLWRSPKGRKLLILGGIGLGVLMFLLQSEPNKGKQDKKPSEDVMQKVEAELKGAEDARKPTSEEASPVTVVPQP